MRWKFLLFLLVAFWCAFNAGWIGFHIFQVARGYDVVIVEPHAWIAWGEVVLAGIIAALGLAALVILFNSCRKEG